MEETGVPPKRRKPKGHKHDKLRLLRLADIEQKLQDMPAKVAEYRVRFAVDPHWRAFKTTGVKCRTVRRMIVCRCRPPCVCAGLRDEVNLFPHLGIDP